MAGNNNYYLHMWLLLAIVFEAVAVSSGHEQIGHEVNDSDTARTSAQNALEDPRVRVSCNSSIAIANSWNFKA